MQAKGSRCGSASRGSSGPGAIRAACVGLVALFACALPAAGSEPQAIAGSATIVIHGQGRVTSEPAGAIDCPGDCTHAFVGSTSLTLRATPTTGWATAQIGSCGETDVCTVPLNDFDYTIDVYFRPRAKLQVWPNGDGAITLSPTPADWLGEPDPNPCTPATAFAGTGCELYYVPGTVVTATAAATGTSTFLGWSAHRCAGTGPCAVTLSRDSTSLVARFTPLEVRVVPGGTGAGDHRQRAARDLLPADLHRAVPLWDRGDADRNDPIRPRRSWPGSSAARRPRIRAAAC